ncbi:MULTISPECIES: hypothetical protein [Oleiagrimonas]|uniref:Uncharacterized protein n=1 Tax=Oleiagrimonas citrea TaxID=1665687 RepID=A0A846ZJX7_9GAMM|nr:MULTISPECIES: hypothetical protein [Oleiagrimonas]NKZ37858.1 hypothetical protein [Oleiagrimonas citrea]
MNTPTLPWYRVPEVWLMIVLLSAAVAGGITTLVIAERLPDAQIHNPNTQGRLHGH